VVDLYQEKIGLRLEALSNTSCFLKVLVPPEIWLYLMKPFPPSAVIRYRTIESSSLYEQLFSKFNVLRFRMNSTSTSPTVIVSPVTGSFLVNPGGLKFNIPVSKVS